MQVFLLWVLPNFWYFCRTSVRLDDVCLGVGDIIEKNYRQPIYRNFSNYRQIIDIEFWEFGNYRKIIDIENCIQFYPINTIESIVLKTRKGPRWSTEKLLVARDFWCSKANTDSFNVCEKCTDGARYKICCEKHNSWTCQTKIFGGFAIEANIVE